MKRYIYILMVAVSLSSVAGCKKDSDPHTNDDQAVSVDRSPVHQAEVFVQIRGLSGQSSVTAWLVYSHKSMSASQKDNSIAMSKEQWKTEKCSVSFDLKDGRKCTIDPIFLDHKNDSDIWLLDISYTSTEKQADAELSRTSKESRTVAFDGNKPSMVIEDDHHSIVIRPRSVDTEHQH